MTRGFQIWPKKSNRTKFDTFLAKTLENWITPVFDRFFFAEKGVKCSSFKF